MCHEYSVSPVNRDTRSPNRREFLAGTIGVGALGWGIDPDLDELWSEHSGATDTTVTVEAVVRFVPADGGGTTALQRHARRTQRPFERFADEQSGIGIERQFWAANAALVSLDLGRVSRDAVLGVDGVTAVHPNYAGGPGSAAAETSSASPGSSDGSGEVVAENEDVTYPLAEMNVPQAWEFHDTRGEGVDVAVIDTGIDTTGHEGLAASLERGGWAEFDEFGDRLDTDPNAGSDVLSGHGTATSGVIAGGTNDDGERYGIAPAVNLYHAKAVSEPPEGIRLLSVIAGIEWAIERDVDVLTMSLGLPQYNYAFVEPVRNAVESGILTVGSTGNSGHYTGVSPSNVPGVLSAGGVDDDRALYGDSSGERIETERYWGDAAAEEWPEEYSVPDVTAPAVNVPTAVPNGEFTSEHSGTSYAAPCTAAVAALALSATDADAETVRDAIVGTARHPAATDDFDVDPGRDDRYGQGIVSALGAISHLRASETLSGTVTDESGTPLAGVTVGSEVGLTTETDSQGTYELTVPPGAQPVGAVGVGFEPTGTRLDPTETDSQSFELAPSENLDVEMRERMATRVDPGEAATATFEVVNIESLMVDLDASGPVDPKRLVLTVDDETVDPGEPVTLDGERTRITVGVAVPEDVLVARFRASYEFAAGDVSITGRGHRVHAHSDPLTVAPSDPPELQTPINLMAPRTTLELTDGQGDAIAREGDDAGLVVDKPLTLTAAEGATPTVRFSNEGAEAPAAVLVLANDVTVSRLEIDGTGARTGVQVGLSFRETFREGAPWPSGVTVRDLFVAGADTAVRSYQTPALRIANNELTAETTGVSVSGRAKTSVRENDVSDVETGIEATGQVAAIEGNTLSNVSGTGILIGTPRFLSRHWGRDVGPVRSNTVTGANRGIVVSGVTTLPVEENYLSDIDETALVVEGGVLAPIRSNRVENADRGVAIADDAEVGTVTDNEFRNVRDPGVDRATDTPDGTDLGTRTTPGEETTVTERNTGSTAGPEAGTTATSARDTRSPSGRDDESDEGGESDSGGSGPGLGIGTALAGLGGAGYLLRRRLADDGPESE